TDEAVVEAEAAEPAAADSLPPEALEAEAGDDGDESSSSHRYRTQRRGGKGIRDIKTTQRNGPVVGIAAVRDDDELLMITARGKLQRIAAGEVSLIGRNTQGVRIMSMDEADTLAAIVRVPQEDAAVKEEEGADEVLGAEGKPTPPPPPAAEPQ
ncbi:MAG TPA: DNA gyrase C-terminal beta-propeller domain-containing protein, partial [Pirellulales bacterium]|nr:DNA gyrase C-terminal beta-propeller domain-containing protein [Pirellulales bacterium]